MKSNFFILFFLAGSFLAGCTSRSFFSIEEKKLIENLARESQGYIDAYTKLDAEKIVAYTNDSYLQDNGGKEQYLAQFKADCQEFMSRGDKITDFTLSEPDSLIQIGNTLYAVCKQTLHHSVVEADNQTYEILNTVIVSSADSGKTWKFLGLHGLEEEKIKAFIPGFTYEGFGVKKEVKAEGMPSAN